MNDGKQLHTDAIRLSPEDNVATVLRPIDPGEQVRVQCGTTMTTMLAAEPIPLCHKISLSAVAAGGVVVKYGEPIGTASTTIVAGAHVHVHNMQSARARAGMGTGGPWPVRG